jgi:hypothetical protein
MPSKASCAASAAATVHTEMSAKPIGLDTFTAARAGVAGRISSSTSMDWDVT